MFHQAQTGEIMTEPEKTSKTIGEIVAENYRTSADFEKYGIDFIQIIQMQRQMILEKWQKL